MLTISYYSYLNNFKSISQHINSLTGRFTQSDLGGSIIVQKGSFTGILNFISGIKMKRLG